MRSNPRRAFPQQPLTEDEKELLTVAYYFVSYVRYERDPTKPFPLDRLIRSAASSADELHRTAIQLELRGLFSNVHVAHENERPHWAASITEEGLRQAVSFYPKYLFGAGT